MDLYSRPLLTILKYITLIQSFLKGPFCFKLGSDPF